MPQDFLAAVLPTEGNGLYCFADLLRKKHVFVGTIPELHAEGAHIDALNIKKKLAQQKSAGSFFALATYQTPLSRKAANVSHLRCIYADLDCGGGDKCYSSKKEAVAALLEFLKATGLDKLGVPWLVDSGGGVHVYWPMQENIPVEVWLRTAQAMKATAMRLGFRIDMTVTDDAARVLRIPDTHNYKLPAPRKVTIRQVGATFELAAFTACLDVLEEKKPRPPRIKSTGPLSALDQALTQQHDTYFKDIVVRTQQGTGCSQIAYYFEHAKDDGMEPMWRAMLSLAKVCEDAPMATEKLTKAHPYTLERMHEKLDTIKGPYSCEKIAAIQPGVCEKCVNYRKFTNPLMLGRRVMQLADAAPRKPKVEPEAKPDVADEVVDGAGAGEVVDAEIEQEDIPNDYKPRCPSTFFYVRGGGIAKRIYTYDKKGMLLAEEDVIILPYHFYMVDTLQEGQDTRARFAVERPNGTTFVTIPCEAMGSKDSVIKELARQNVISHKGPHNDQNLFLYVRAFVEQASFMNTALHVPPRYGWQPDDSFAVGDTVIKKGGESYTFTSEKLLNLINTTSTKGSLVGWQEYVGMIQKKKLYGVLGCMLVSFGSPLMRWAGSGTPAMLMHACHKESGHGKSTAIHMAASVWGHPTSFPVKPATSATTMLQRAGMLGCMPLLVDEITAVARKDREFAPTLVYNYAQGGHKLKGSGAGNMELSDDLYWNAVGLITSNEPLMERMLSARDTTSFGEIMRLLEWHPTESIVWTDQERLLKHALADNYGLAGRKYAEWLVNNMEVARALYDKVTERFRIRCGASDVERYWVAAVGANITGAILCSSKYAGVFDFDIEAITLEYVRWISHARKLLGSNVRVAEDIVDAYTREFFANFIVFDNRKGPKALFNDGTSPTSTARGRIAGRVEYNVRAGWIDYFIDITTLKRYASERNISYEVMKSELNRTKSVATEVRKDLLARTGGPVLRVACLQISREISVEEELDKDGPLPLE
jgi:hypothetical protein